MQTITLLSVLLVSSFVVASVTALPKEENPLLATEQERGCVGTKEKCIKDDDCSCCGVWDKCDCNNINEPGVCRCMRAMIYTNIKKRVLCP